MKQFLIACLAAMMLLSFCGGCAPEKSPQPEGEKPPAASPSLEESPQTGAIPTPDAPTDAEPAPVPGDDPIVENVPVSGNGLTETILASMSLEAKVGQLFFPRCPAKNAEEDIAAYHLGGYVLFGRDVKDADGNWLTKEQFTEKVQHYQSAALADTGIPLLLGSDEEGGTVRRLSANPNLVPKPFFQSPQWLWEHRYDEGSIFAEYAWEGSHFLLDCGMNVNLAPVCDVSTDPDAFIYGRTLGQDAEATAEFVRSVAGAMSGAGIGSVLKHFPGYGNNADTHTGIAVDARALEDFEVSDLLPFAAGMEAGGKTTAVMVSHNIVECMDAQLPASLSPAVHRYLREEMGFDGVVMTDDLAMEAVSAYAGDGSVAVMALQAGNDLIITTDYRTQIPAVIAAVENGTLDTAVIDTACRRVLEWKQALGLLGS